MIMTNATGVNKTRTPILKQTYTKVNLPRLYHNVSLKKKKKKKSESYSPNFVITNLLDKLMGKKNYSKFDTNKMMRK